MRRYLRFPGSFRVKISVAVFCFLFLGSKFSSAQVICIFCYGQNDSISYNVHNLLLNGGFENHNCIPGNWFSSSYCPNSAYYNCDISDWTCTGGGSNTYADMIDINYAQVVEGSYATYFGSSYCRACSSNANDTSCLTAIDCTAGGVPTGFPVNDPGYGGALGLSIEQTVSGLSIGNTYVLEFWAGGEANQPAPGLFAADVGFGNIFLRDKATPGGGTGTRFVIEFNATATSHTIKFTNWGHICGLCTELILDDVRLYTLAELSPVVPPCSGANIAALFTAPNNICPGTCTNFTNLSLNATSYLWNFPGSSTPSSTDINPQNICYNIPGNYDVTLIATSATSSDTLLLMNYITVYPTPPPQGITQSGDTLIANQGAVAYQWYHDGNIIPGATDYFYIAVASGDYNVVATDVNNCEVEAVIYDVVAGIRPDIDREATGNRQPAISPNPVGNQLLIHNLEFTGQTTFDFSIYDMFGVMVLLQKFSTGTIPSPIDVSSLANGIYWLEIKSAGKTTRHKFIKCYGW